MYRPKYRPQVRRIDWVKNGPQLGITGCPLDSIPGLEVVADHAFVVRFVALQQRWLLQPKHRQPRHQDIGQRNLAAFVAMLGYRFEMLADRLE